MVDRLSALYALKMKLAGLFLLLMSAAAYPADQATLPLLSIDQWDYIGGFRIPPGEFGVSGITYSEGPIALGANGKSLFMVGHPYQQAIGEFSIPTLVNSLDYREFRYAANVQTFSKVLDRAASGNPQHIDRIGGMALINGQLVVNTYVYYDAAVTATDTTLVIRDAANLATSAVAGYHRYSARAHATGWLSPIPASWQGVLGGTYITGNSSGPPIISRLSVGPTAFVFDAVNPDLGNLSPRGIALTTLLDFSLDHPLSATPQAPSGDLNNQSRTNDIWTHLSRAVYGFIVPGTRTYMTIGDNGGMESGIGYKNLQDNGELCGGYCAYKSADYSNYYWLWNMDDLVKAKSGQMKSYDVRPYAYGRFTRPHAGSGYNPIIGATFDAAGGTLYLSLAYGDSLGVGGWAPLIVAFKLGLAEMSPPSPPGNISVQSVKP